MAKGKKTTKKPNIAQVTNKKQADSKLAFDRQNKNKTKTKIKQPPLIKIGGNNKKSIVDKKGNKVKTS